MSITYELGSWRCESRPGKPSMIVEPFQLVASQVSHFNHVDHYGVFQVKEFWYYWTILHNPSTLASSDGWLEGKVSLILYQSWI